MKIKKLQQARNRMSGQIIKLKTLLKYFKKKSRMCEMTTTNLMATLPSIMKWSCKRKIGRSKMFSAEMRAFALTLHFYSPKAYKYVRKTCNNILPHVSTIHRWYAVIDGRPGFTKEIFEALKCQVRKQQSQVFCNLVIDEIAIRQQVIYDGKRYYGHVNLGIDAVNNERNDSRLAKNALVFMVVALNSYWKAPVGYFLIDSLTGKERAKLMTTCLQLIHETGVTLHSLTFDGASVNFSMCANLGANFTLGEQFKPYILHPITKEKIFCFWDPCHMLKLVRNTLGDKLKLRYKAKTIYWENIVTLQRIQESEGLRCTTKITKRHILFKNARMNVKLAAQTLSESVSNMMSSISESTLKNYNVGLKRWWLFCRANAVELYKPSIPEVLAFLTRLYEEGLSHSTINCVRSAISLIAATEVAQDVRVQRFFKGISNLRPSRPKYDFTWNPKIVLDYFIEQPADGELNLSMIAKKLITLLALVTGHRMQTFSLIELDNIRISADKIEISIPARIKTSKRNAMQPLLTLPFFHNRKICAASTLLHYLDSTKGIRNAVKKLFISNNKPIKAVSTQSLSRWVKEVLTSSGINTTVFSAHSTRHASTSAAKRLGVDLDLIRKTAGWTKESKIFAKFYDREVISDKQQFALSILEG